MPGGSGEYTEVPMEELPTERAAGASPSMLEQGGKAPSPDAEKKSKESGTPSRNMTKLALLALVFQNSSLILTMKQAALVPSEDGKKALTSTVVVMVEVFKVRTCCAIAVLSMCSRALSPRPPRPDHANYR